MRGIIQRCARLLPVALVFWALSSAFTTPPPAHAGPDGPPRAEGDGPLGWFVGNWSLSYQDRHLGDVKGRAVVRANPAEPTMPFVEVKLRAPDSDREYSLDAIRVGVADGVLLIELWGASPSGARAADGESSPPNGEVITVPRDRMGSGAKLTARYERESAQQSASPVDVRPGCVRLLFPLPGSTLHVTSLEGAWRARRNPTTGFTDLRTGELDSTGQWMTNPEVWKRDAIRITNATPVDLRDFNTFLNLRDRESTLLQDFWLRIEGTGLPSRRGESCVVVFDDENIEYLGDHRPDPDMDDALQIRCALHRGIQPSPKHFTLNGAPGVWQFDFPGNFPAAVRFIRKLNEVIVEPTVTAYQGELVYVELVFDHEPFYDNRTMVLIPPGRPPIRFQAVKGRGESGEPGHTDYPKDVFRSTVSFLLLPFWEEEDPDSSRFQGGADHVETSLHRGQRAIVRAKAGDVLRSTVIDVIADPLTLPVGFATVAQRPSSEWDRAMETARKCFARHPDRYVDTSYFINPVETWGRKQTTGMEALLGLISPLPVRERSTHMSVEDHAACILLYEELRGGLLRYFTSAGSAPPRNLHGDVNPEYLRAQDLLIQGLMYIAGSGQGHPLLHFDVAGPGTGETMPLGTALNSVLLSEHFGSDRDAMMAYLRRAVRDAQVASAGAAADSMAALTEIGTDEPIELLKAVGLGYESVALTVARRLFRSSDVSLGEPVYPEWVPDKRAREAIKSLGILVQNFNAEEAYSAASRDYTLMIATLPLMAASLPAVLAARAGVAVSTGAQAAARLARVGMAIMDYGVGSTVVASSVLKWHHATEMTELARGLSGATGEDSAFLMRQAEDDAAFWNMITSAGMSYGPQIFGRAIARGLRPSIRSMEAASEKVMRRGLASLNPQERAAFDFLSGRAAHRVAKGGQALDDLDRLAIRAQYPDGIPPEMARQIGIDPGTIRKVSGETTVTRLDEPTIGPTGETTATLEGHRTNGGRFDPDATLGEPMRNDLLTPCDDIRPQDSTNPVIRELYCRAASESSNGKLAAVGRQRTLETMEREWRRLPPVTQGRVLEAMEIFRRLRRENPRLANLDPAEAMRMMAFHARGAQPGSAGANALTPQDLVSRVAAWNRVPIDNARLARASNGSMLEAEIASGQARRWADRFNGDGSPGTGAGRRVAASDGARSGHSTSRSEPINRTGVDEAAGHSHPDFQAITEGDVRHPTRITRQESRPPPVYEAARQNGRPVPPSHPDGGMFNRAEREIQRELERLGIDPRDAAMRSVIPAARGVDPGIAAVGAGFDDFRSATFLRERLGLSDARIRSSLDEYLRRVRLVERPARRQQLIADFFKRESVGSITEPPPIVPSPVAGAGEASLAGLAASAREENIARLLERMGVDPLAARLESAVAASRGLDPPAAAAGVVFNRLEGPPALRRGLGMSDSQIRSALNDYLRKVRLVDDAPRRCRLIDEFMQRESRVADPSPRTPAASANPPTPITEIEGIPASANEADIYRQLRDLGCHPVHARLQAAVASSRGATPRTAGVGSAFEDFSKGPAFLRERMGLADRGIRDALDDYLERVRLVDTAAERERLIDRFMRRDDPTISRSNPGRPPGPNDTAPPPRPDTHPDETAVSMFADRDGNPISRDDFIGEIERSLRDLVSNPAAAGQLDLDYLVGEHGLTIDELVAITGMALEVDPRALQARLLARDAAFGQMLDRGFRILNPEMGSLRRAEAIGRYLREGGIREGAELVFEGRNAAVRNALRAIGADRVDMLCVYRGLEVEAVAAGQAFDQFIPPERLKWMRGMTDESIRTNLDSYLRITGDVSDPARRTALIDAYLAGRHRPASTPPPPLLERPEAVPRATAEDIGRSLERVGLPAVEARALADDLWDVAWDSPYGALAAAAYRRGIPAKQLETLGLNRAQVVDLLDDYLRVHAGLTNVRLRARVIAENYLAATEGRAFTADEVLSLLLSEEARPPAPSKYRPPHPEELVRPTLGGPDAPVDPLADTAMHRHTPLDRPGVTADLDEKFGRVNEAGGWGLRNHEVAAGGHVLENPERLVLTGDVRLPALDPGKRYIWVVDEHGQLIFGAATPVCIGPDGMVPRLSHPSLTNNGPARIAGELVWSEIDRTWVITNRGGRYSAHADMNLPQLRRVGGLFERAGLDNFGIRFDRASNPWASRDP